MAVYDDEEQKDQHHVSGDSEERAVASQSRDSDNEKSVAEREGVEFSDSAISSSESTEHTDDSVGRGYQEDSASKGKKRRGKLSGTKKKISIAITGTIISGIVALIAFFSLIPIKIVSTVTNLDNIYNSAQRAAVKKTGHRLFTRYIVNDVLNALDKKGCKSTISPKCVVVPSGSGPIGKLHKAWSTNRIERKLAENGLIFGKKGSTYYMQVNGKDLSLNGVLDELRSGEKDLFELEGTNRADTRDIRRAVRTAFKDATLWDKTYTRFKVGRYLVNDLGLPRCVGVWGCDPDSKRTQLKESLESKKVAAKAFIVGRTLTPMAPGFSYMVMCIMNGGCDYENLEDAQEGDTDRQTRLNKEINLTMTQLAARQSNKDLETLNKEADEMSNKGLLGYTSDRISNNINSQFGRGAVKAGAKAIPFVGWSLLAVQLVNAAQTIGPLVKYASYAVNSAAAQRLYMDYSTVAGQIRSGHTDATAAGSFSNALSSNMDPDQAGTDKDVGMTNSPLYARLLEPNNNQNLAFSGALGDSTVLAAGNKQVYRCENGDPVSVGNLVCEEENLAKGNDFATGLSRGLKETMGPVISGIIDKVADFIGFIEGVIGDAIGALIKPFIDACTSGVGDFVGCKDVYDNMKDLAAKIVEKVAGALISTPFSDTMSGARTFNMLAAGADVTSNDACKELLGCERVTAKKATAIRREQLAQLEADFKARPLFARIFDTSSPYSLASRVAVSMPASLTTAGNNLASTFVGSPFTAFGGLFGSMFSSEQAFANTAPSTSPFNVAQYAVPENKIPKNPQRYWNNNCKERYDPFLGLDNSDWLNNEDNVGFNDKTGESYYKRPDLCRLLLSSIQAVGGMFDSSLIPDDERNSENGNTTVIGGSTGSVSSKGWAWPVAKNDYVPLSNCFQKPGHTGIDIPVGVGTPVHAAKSGTVVATDPTNSSDAGNYIIIKHGNGQWTNYQHNSRILVSEGQKVEAGQVIARSGNSGFSTGAHVHFSVTTREGLDSRHTVAYSVNPLNFLPKDGRNLGDCG